MSYEKDDAKLYVPGVCAEADNGEVCFHDPEHTTAPYAVMDEEGRPTPVPCAYLPHSCDQWVIGGPEELRLMIAELTALIEKIS